MMTFVKRKNPGKIYHDNKVRELWDVICKIEGKDIKAGSIPLTAKAISHWRSTKDNLGYALFNGLSLHDIKSIVSATKVGKANMDVERQGRAAFYKIK